MLTCQQAVSSKHPPLPQWPQDTRQVAKFQPPPELRSCAKSIPAKQLKATSKRRTRQTSQIYLRCYRPASPRVPGQNKYCRDTRRRSQARRLSSRITAYYGSPDTYSNGQYTHRIPCLSKISLRFLDYWSPREPSLTKLFQPLPRVFAWLRQADSTGFATLRGS
jgi:hypothetical protein